MKILHISDLHLGAKTENFSRISEQKQTLDEIVQISNEQNIDIVLIAGDIFHVANPSAEAEELLYNFLEKLTQNNNRVVLIISGNHDDPKRLACCAPLAKSHNIVICTDLSPLPTYKKQGKVQIIKTDRGFAKIQKETETVCVALLPYATKSRIEQSVADLNLSKAQTYSQEISTWASLVSKNFEKNSFNVFVAHQYIIGAKEQQNGKLKTVSIGSTLAIPANVFPNCNYVALGHLHTNQLVKGTKNTYYSGATTTLRIYDEAPSVNIIDTTTGSVTKQELKNYSKIQEIQATNFSDALKKLKKLNSNALVYLKLTKTTALSAIEIKELKSAGTTVVSISFTQPKQEKQNIITNAKDHSPEQLFSLFVKEKTGSSPSEQMLEMFLNLMEEQNETDNA